MYSTRTRCQRRRSGCNVNTNTMTKFKHTTGRILRRPEWSYVDQGDILYDTEIEQTRTDEKYVTKNEEEQEVERGRSSAAKDQNDSEGLVMDDS